MKILTFAKITSCLLAVIVTLSLYLMVDRFLEHDINQKVSLVTDVTDSLLIYPFVFGFLGFFVGLLMLLFGFSSEKSSSIDWFGLMVGMGMLLMFIFMPIYSVREVVQLNVYQHGYFDTMDVATAVVYRVTCFTVFVWSVVRIFKAGFTNFGKSLVLFGFLNILGLVIGWIVAENYGAMWVS